MIHIPQNPQTILSDDIQLHRHSHQKARIYSTVQDRACIPPRDLDRIGSIPDHLLVPTQPTNHRRLYRWFDRSKYYQPVSSRQIQVVRDRLPGVYMADSIMYVPPRCVFFQATYKHRRHFTSDCVIIVSRYDQQLGEEQNEKRAMPLSGSYNYHPARSASQENLTAPGPTHHYPYTDSHHSYGNSGV
jgi:hypothetical protein